MLCLYCTCRSVVREPGTNPDDPRHCKSHPTIALFLVQSRSISTSTSTSTSIPPSPNEHPSLGPATRVFPSSDTRPLAVCTLLHSGIMGIL